MAREEWLPAPYHELEHMGPWVKVIVRIRENATGEIVETEQKLAMPDDAESPREFIWSEGNYACDCNRHLFFHRAKGREPEEDVACGTERYAISILNAKTRRPFYDEFED